MSTGLDVIVVGGGAAGIIAAVRASELGARVLLLEKNERLGMKILISGGGKCNLTHDGSMEELRAKFRPNEARFLKPSFYKFTNKQFLSILHRRDMSTYVRPDGRIFPVEPGDAKVVVRLLSDYAHEAGVTLRYNSAVTGIEVCPSGGLSVQTDAGPIYAGSVVIAVGGASYPATGTTGDGWRWVKDLGHSLVPLRAALAPIYLVDSKPEWSGVALRNVCLKARAAKYGKEFARWSGDLLYTHKGISGPTALAISREVAEFLASEPTPPHIEADLVPSTPYERLREELRTAASNGPRATVSSLLTGFLPARLLGSLFTESGSNPDLRAGQLPAKALTKIVSLLKEWPLGAPASVPIERGEVVAGGVSLDEVNPQTMESKIVPGLYLCGEILDIAGPVGGYNLQAAWSTGYVAGAGAATRAANLPAGTVKPIRLFENNG